MQVPPSADYFLPNGVPEQLSQGDIFVCASGTVIDAVGREIPMTPPPAPNFQAFGSVHHALAWGPPAEAVAAAPATAHETRWGLVMVVSHDCELQKDFNGLITQLVKAGTARDAAVEEAQRRTDLDRFVVVAPLLLYDEMAQEWPPELRTAGRVEGVRQGQRLNYLPVPASPAHRLPLETVASLGRLGVVERRLLTPKRHVASLTQAALGNLRYRLGRLYASRDVSVLAELEDAVGQTITNVEARHVPGSGKKALLSVELHLSDGSILHLQSPVEALTKSAPGGPSRKYETPDVVGDGDVAGDGLAATSKQSRHT